VRATLPVADGADETSIFRRGSDGALIALMADDVFHGSDAGGPGTLWASTSLDGGATFSPPAAIANGANRYTVFRMAPGEQSVFALKADTGGLFLRHAPFTGPDPRVLNIDEAANSTSEATLTVLPDGRMLAAQETLGNVGWRVFTGGDPFDVNAWPKRGTLRGQREPVLVSGPRGVFLLDFRALSDQRVGDDAPFGIRSFDTKRLRWRAARSAGADQAIYGGADLHQDPSGRLHLISTTDNPSVAGCLLYSRTGTRSSSWFGRTTVLFRTRSAEREPLGPVVAAAPDGRGVALWHDRRGPTGSEGNVWALPLKQAKGRYRPISNSFNRPHCGQR
jgi:hypothetical protein